MISLLAVLLIGCIGAETKNVVNGLKCQENLENLFGLLVSYGNTHEQFPLDDAGQLKLDMVSQDATTQEVKCPKNRVTSCYLFRKGIRPTDLDPERTGDPTIIAMDVANNHPVVDGKERVQVLMNQGFAQSLLLDIEEAASWRKQLAEGNVFSSSTE